ncbi:hypothetical protein LOTGIDRAFT_155580 [Lottia gigantea]|uniref:Uncharacterized protein n=1 Tax=Lottia gigantea TaxID=225164 RepID=V3ZP22_LOTGI|nr:hypothetical protein LOTGIDRAFT_155580 [Lottia gigantea]ESO84245.1 hypothetical protein LOTGIDRAFT_155580 [Lottia gigantea]
MSGLRKLKLFQCRMKHFLLLTFIVWTSVFLIFWTVRDATSNAMLVHKSCKECMNTTGVLRAASKHSTEHRGLTPIYIVEEHHEVLPYWFGSAQKGLIPKTNNVLLHIDGHIDGAPPPIFEILPLFRQPVSSAEVSAMMQKNDVFIAGAAQSGLISRFIWVWPPWDRNLTAINNDHIQATVEMGLVKGLPQGHAYPVCFCLIASEPSTASTLSLMNKCLHLTVDDSELYLSESEIPKSKCDIKRTLSVEVVNENKALELSKSGNWLKENDNIILDIDEDYYGCEPAIQPLYDVGITYKESDTMTDLIGKIFCPVDINQERQFDTIFYDLIQQIKTIKSYSQRRNLKVSKENESKVLFTALKDKVKSNNLEQYLCKDKSLDRAIIVLIKYLFSATQSQLSAISKVGLCLSISSKTFEFNPADGMRLCDGFNRPNRTMVVFHTPDLPEINIRTANLEGILRSTPTPAIVTICRSVRDGYSPLKYFEKIESDILKTLKNTYNINHDSIHYDDGLLGGKAGLPSRHL